MLIPISFPFQIGETVKVLEMNMNGEWEGIIGDKQGFFPFTHVSFIDDPPGDAS